MSLDPSPQPEASATQRLPGAPAPVIRPGLRFLFAHPAHFIALGAGSGLSGFAPGTVGTLWAWVAFLLIDPWMNDLRWVLLIGASLLIGVWACMVTARHMQVMDPGAIVWDEVVAFWIVLWFVMPTNFWGQLAAFFLFRAFDVLKPGPIAWADQRFKGIGWKGGMGIVLDDLLAAFAVLLSFALWRAI